jgi:hypothetical protein
MENYNVLSNSRLESNSEGKLESYFQRAGILGHIVVMIGFYALVAAAFLIF